MARRPIAHDIAAGLRKVPVLGEADLVICVGLVASALILKRWITRENSEAVSTVVGALVGAAALLLGNWINRRNDEKRKQAEAQSKLAEAADKISKIKTLVTARLVAVALKLISAKKLADAGYVSNTIFSAGELGTLPETTGLMRDLGTELLVLDSAVIDALETFDTNLEISAQQLRAETGGFLSLMVTLKGLEATMHIAAECFERIAPNRLFILDKRPAEQASVILRRLATFPSK